MLLLILEIETGRRCHGLEQGQPAAAGVQAREMPTFRCLWVLKSVLRTFALFC